MTKQKKTTSSLFRFDVRRAGKVRNVPERVEYHLGDEEGEDLSEVTTTATPVHKGDGGTLTITVEDDAGPRPSAIETHSAFDPLSHASWPTTPMIAAEHIRIL